MKFDANLPKNNLLIQLVTLKFLDESLRKNKMEDFNLPLQEKNKKYELKEKEYIKEITKSAERLEEKVEKVKSLDYLENSDFKNKLYEIKNNLDKYHRKKEEIAFMIYKYNSTLSKELSNWFNNFIESKNISIQLEKTNIYSTKAKDLVDFIKEKDSYNYIQEKKDYLEGNLYSIEIPPKKYILLKTSDILELKQLNSLLRNDIVYSQENKYDLSYTISITKKEIFMRSYYKLAFKIIFLKLLQAHYICKFFSIKDFYFLPLEGLRLYHCENLVHWQNSHHILRCDNCHEQVEYSFERFFSSSSETQESEFICPKCGEHYTYSKLEEIYKKNCEKAYK